VFFFDRIMEDIQGGAVIVNDRKGAYLCVKHLLEQGYRRILHMAGAGHINIYRDRKLGYRDALEEAGIDPDPEWIVEYPLVIEGGQAAFEASMRKTRKPDAFFCAGDFAALGVLRAAERAGYHVPNDLGICGFANEPFTEFTHPSLTTVDQRGYEMGRQVAEVFMHCDLENDPSDPCEKKIIEPRLILRESSVRI
jgi:LacI family transcriptional regulator